VTSTVVVGVDDSPRADDALALAGTLAGPLADELVVATVYPQVGRPWLPGGDDARDERRAAAQAALDAAREALGDPPATTYRAVGASSAAEGLDHLAEKVDAGLLVVAQTHRGRLRRVAGVAEQLLHGATRPVAVAPPGLAEHGAAIDRVAVGFDGSPQSADAVHQAAVVAKATGASLRVVGVFDTLQVAWVGPSQTQVNRDFADEMIRALRAGLDAAVERFAAGVEVDAEVIEGTPAGTLVAVSEDADLLVCGSRGMGPVGATLVGSVSNRLVHSAACAVLAVPRGSDVLGA
jgi:nucleotide-binding universal stress UspA family protein